MANGQTRRLHIGYFGRRMPISRRYPSLMWVQGGFRMRAFDRRQNEIHRLAHFLWRSIVRYRVESPNNFIYLIYGGRYVVPATTPLLPTLSTGSKSVTRFFRWWFVGVRPCWPMLTYADLCRDQVRLGIFDLSKSRSRWNDKLTGSLEVKREEKLWDRMAKS